MVATVIINRLTGAAPTPTATPITSINTRANAYDTHSVADTTNPIQIPAAGSNYSYWVQTQLETTVAPSGTIDNLRWYTDGSNTLGTGVTCNVTKGQYADYVQATGTPGVTGTVLNVTNYPGIDDTPSDAFAKTSGSPYALLGSTTTTEKFGDIVIYQIVVGTTAVAGATGSETFTFMYDET